MKSPNKIFIKRRTFWMIILPVSFVTAVLLAVFLLKQGGSSRLDDYKRTLEQSGETLDIAKLAPVAPKENNPAEAFLAACKELSTLASEKNFTPIAGPFPVDESGRLPRVVELPNPPIAKDVAPKSWETLTAEAEIFSPSVDKLHETSSAPGLEFRPVYSADLDYKQDALNALLLPARVVATDGVLALRANRVDRVIEDIDTLISLALAQQKQPMLYSQTISHAMTGLAQNLTWQLIQSHSANDAQLAQLQAVWGKVDPTKNLPAILRFERALTAQNSGKADEKLEILMRYQELIDAADKASKSGQWSTFLQSSDAISESFKDRSDSDLFVRTLRAIPDELVGIIQAQAQVNMTIAALGLERFASSEIGHPTTLDELVPEYLAAVPLDPFDNQPLRYKATPSDGFLLYSVGTNGIDENGDVSLFNQGTSGRQKDITWPRPAPIEVPAE